ncbi:MAG: response regulator [Myxococcales bacterium FL481]|nr:MAG: response regulator [Myxococcales bacterium FL481]
MDDHERDSMPPNVRTLRSRIWELHRRTLQAGSAELGPNLDPGHDDVLADAKQLTDLGTWAWDMRAGTASWTPELYRILGYPPDVDPATERFFGAIHPDDRARVLELTSQSVVTGESLRTDFVVLRPDGTLRNVTMTATMVFDDDGQPWRLVGAVLDLTDAGEALEQNRRAFEQLEDAQAIGRLGSWRYDARRRGLTWSREFCRILGLPPDTAPDAQVVVDRIHKRDQAHFSRAKAQILHHANSADAEYRIVRPDGDTRDVRVNAVARRDDDGSLIDVRGTLLDITEQVRQREDLAHDQKMEAIGRLAGGIAHDFNNLLTIVTTNLDLARETLVIRDVEVPPELAECQRALTSASALIRRLLTFGRQAALSLRLLDVNQMIRGAMVLIRRLVGESIVLETDLAHELAPVRVDAVEIERALLNLVSNARDAVPNGGRVRIETRTVHEADLSYVEIAVSDDGPGLEPWARHRVFEPFFTTKPEGQGTGLGLASVLGTAEQHGGTVVVDCPPEGGTVFRMRLPAANQSAIEPEEPSDALAAPSRDARQQVLVVDDEPQVARVIQHSLQRRGYAVSTATDPAAARALWAERGRKIDLVICDVVMTPVRGPELVREFAQARPLPPVLFITGYSEEAAQSDLDHPVLTKPFSVAELTAAVERALCY